MCYNETKAPPRREKRGKGESGVISFRRDPEIRVQNIRIPVGKRQVPALVLRPRETRAGAPGVLWIHGGGYITGMKEMVYGSRAVDLVKDLGAVVLSPGYRLAPWTPYPGALEDCYGALLYLKEQARALGVREDRLMVGGESAGGGLAAAVCLLARDRGEVQVAFQMPLYPMLDDRDTETSRDNHGRVWNTRKNHFAWGCYLRGQDRENIPVYAAAARERDLSGLPPAYTFVGEGEPFYAETAAYVEGLRAAGVPAELDVYPTDMHAFDLMDPEGEWSREAARRFREAAARALERYAAPQRDSGKGGQE